MSNDLPIKQARILEAVQGKGDVPILTIYRHAWAADAVPDIEQRTAQQFIGAHISKLNRRIRAQKLAVKPGRLKGTYYLAAL